jgi:DNA-binding response OmpR family regulator
MLHAYGVATVLEADSAFEAYSILKSSRVDLMLIDVIMPSIGGIKLLRAIRQTAATSRVPIIMMTASRDAVHVQDARAAWADGYLLKPFTTNSLHAMITAALRGKGFAGPAVEENGERSARKIGPVRVSRFFRRN